MIVRADELQYDNTNNRIIAIGNVQIYYKRSTLEADRVIYEQNTKRMRAEGNARFTEADGKVVHGEIIDLTDQFRDGFVDSLQLEAADKTRFAAPRAERQDGRYTVFQSGVYTACEPCKDDPRKPPRWQVRATRIIHDDTEKMIYFESARLEFFGFPMFYWPYLSTPDPTVKRKSGFLIPNFGYSSSACGFVSAPYFWALAPNYDFTAHADADLEAGPADAGGMAPPADERLLLDQGGRHLPGRPGRVREAFRRLSGDRPGRSLLPRQHRHHRPVRLNNNWVWGWDGSLVTDNMVIQDYGAAHLFRPDGPVQVRRARNRLATLSDRARRAQLLRRARDVLLRPGGRRRAEPAPDRRTRSSTTGTGWPIRCSAAS